MLFTITYFLKGGFMDIKEMFKESLSRYSVFNNRAIVSPHFIPEDLPYRDEQIKELVNVLSPVMNFVRPNNIFLYGKTGTGKTSSIKKVLNTMETIIFNNAKLKTRVVKYYINCRNHNSKYKIMLKLTTEFYKENYIGYSSSFVYDKIIDYLKKNNIFLILVLDEIDLIKDVDESIYSFSRANDELDNAGFSIIGISNNVMFKEKLDPRTKSSLCQKELLFTPYNAKELTEILAQRVALGFKPGTVNESAIRLASALAAQESGDARTALMLLERAGEISDENGLGEVTDKEIKLAKKNVEVEIIINMISTLPEQQQLVLHSIAYLTKNNKFSVKLLDTGKVLSSGDIYNQYFNITRKLGKSPVSTKWFKQYLEELSLYGLIATTMSGKGVRGTTTLVKLGFDPDITYEVLRKQLGFSA